MREALAGAFVLTWKVERENRILVLLEVLVTLWKGSQGF
jgi:hypothetical protein